MHLAGQRLARLRERARSSAVREMRRTRAYATPPGPPIEAISAVGIAADDDAMILDRRLTARDMLARSDLRVRRIGGFSFLVRLRDISTNGCRIELIEGCEVGEDVITRFPQLEPLGACVRWTLGTSAGIEFMRPIHPAVFKFLRARLRERASAA